MTHHYHKNKIVWEEPTRSQHGYWKWEAHVERDDGSFDEMLYSDVLVTADTSDEQGHQNVLWEVNANGWLHKSGHASTVRKAKAAAAAVSEALISIGPRSHEAPPLPASTVGIAGNVKKRARRR